MKYLKFNTVFFCATCGLALFKALKTLPENHVIQPGDLEALNHTKLTEGVAPRCPGCNKQVEEHQIRPFLEDGHPC